MCIIKNTRCRSARPEGELLSKRSAGDAEPTYKNMLTGGLRGMRTMAQTCALKKGLRQSSRPRPVRMIDVIFLLRDFHRFMVETAVASNRTLYSYRCCVVTGGDDTSTHPSALTTITRYSRVKKVSLAIHSFIPTVPWDLSVFHRDVFTRVQNTLFSTYIKPRVISPLFD